VTTTLATTIMATTTTMTDLYWIDIDHRKTELVQSHIVFGTRSLIDIIKYYQGFYVNAFVEPTTNDYVRTTKTIGIVETIEDAKQLGEDWVAVHFPNLKI
jgi:hypothetical protein